jgi:hypothetical protein
MEDEGNSKDSQPVPDTVTVKTPGATGPVFRATLKGVFSELWPLAAGAVFGVLIRILFSDEPLAYQLIVSAKHSAETGVRNIC